MRIDHIGFVVKDIDRYLSNMPIKDIKKRIYDENQRANLVLLDAQGATIELIEPQDSDSLTWNFLQKGGGWHHICYEVSSEDEALDIIKSYKMLKVTDSMDAPLLDGRVVFARDRNRDIVEFVWRE